MAYEKYGSDVIVDMLKLYGIKYLPLNPGASYRGLHDSIVNYGGNSPEIIECTHEKIAVGLAHGYTRATGEACGAIVHNLVGLLHSAMGVYYAYVDEAPVILLGATGPMDTSRRRPFIDWIHTAQDQGDVVRDFTKWDDQPHTVAAVPESFARAYRVATTPPYGPVYLCYDSNLQEDPLLTEVHLPDPTRLGPPEPAALHSRTVEKVAEMLVQAKNPVHHEQDGEAGGQNLSKGRAGAGGKPSFHFVGIVLGVGFALGGFGGRRSARPEQQQGHREERQAPATAASRC